MLAAELRHSQVATGRCCQTLDPRWVQIGAGAVTEASMGVAFEGDQMVRGPFTHWCENVAARWQRGQLCGSGSLAG